MLSAWAKPSFQAAPLCLQALLPCWFSNFTSNKTSQSCSPQLMGHRFAPNHLHFWPVQSTCPWRSRRTWIIRAEEGKNTRPGGRKATTSDSCELPASNRARSCGRNQLAARAAEPGYRAPPLRFNGGHVLSQGSHWRPEIWPLLETPWLEMMSFHTLKVESRRYIVHNGYHMKWQLPDQFQFQSF